MVMGWIASYYEHPAEASTLFPFPPSAHSSDVGVVRLEVALVAFPPGFEPPADLAALSVVFARSSLFLRVGAWRGMKRSASE